MTSGIRNHHIARGSYRRAAITVPAISTSARTIASATRGAREVACVAAGGAGWISWGTGSKVPGAVERRVPPL